MADAVDLSDLMGGAKGSPAPVDLSDLVAQPAVSSGEAPPVTLDELTVTGKRHKGFLDWLSAMGHKATREVFPTATGAAGAVLGAEIGALGGPAAPITVPLGAVAGGLLGGWAGSRAQRGALQAAPRVAQAMGQSPEQIASEEQAYPVSTALAGVAPALVGGGALQSALTPAESRAAQILAPPRTSVADLTKATQAAAERQGVALPTSLTSPTGYRASRLLPALGTHAIDTAEAAAPKAVGERLQSLASVYDSPTERGAAGEAVQRSAARWAEQQRVKGGDLLSSAETLAGDTAIAPTQAMQFLDAQIAEASQNPQANRPLIQMLSGWKGDLANPDNPLTLKSLRNLKSSIYRTTAPEGLTAGEKARLSGGFWNTLDTDIRNGLMDASADSPKAADALHAYDTGNAVWAERQGTIKSTLGKVLGDKVDADMSDPDHVVYVAQQTPEKAMDAVAGMSTNDRRGFQRLMGTLDPEAQSTVRASLIASLGRDAQGEFNAGKFLSTLNQMPPRTQALLFGRDNLGPIQDLKTIVDNLGQAESRNHSWGSLGVEMAIPALLGGLHGGAEGTGAGLAATAGANAAMAHFLAQPDSLRWLARLAGASQKGTGAFNTALGALGKAANTKASLGPLYDTLQQLQRPAPAAAPSSAAAPAFDPASMSDEQLKAIAEGRDAGPPAEAPQGATVDLAAYRDKPVGELLPAVLQAESGGNPNAISLKGAEGLMQLMPETQRDPGFGVAPAADKSPQENVRQGADYLNAMLERYGGDKALALMAYNWGPGHVDEWLKGGMKGDVPKETRDYLAKILGG